MKVPQTFRMVRDIEEADFEEADFQTARVTIFRDTGCGKVCGWYIGPAGNGALATYLPASDELIASSAVLRALHVAAAIRAEVCVVDPDDLWTEAWGGR